VTEQGTLYILNTLLRVNRLILVTIKCLFLFKLQLFPYFCKHAFFRYVFYKQGVGTVVERGHTGWLHPTKRDSRSVKSHAVANLSVPVPAVTIINSKYPHSFAPKYERSKFVWEWTKLP
jgi:hypothetical protein